MGTYHHAPRTTYYVLHICMKLPTITINTKQPILVKRLLPGLGKVMVQRGQEVRALDTVAQIESPSGYAAINVARHLSNHELDMDKIMHKKVGDVVEAGDVVGSVKGLIRERAAYAPAKGIIAAIGPGWVLLETERTVTKIQAFIDGTVTKISANRGVVIEATGTVVQAVAGFGGEAHGLVKRMVDHPTDYMEPSDIDDHAQNTILLAGQSVDEDVLRAADAHGVRGIIVSTVDAALLDLPWLVKVCVVATEGFGDRPMSSHTFATLRHIVGHEVSIRGVTPSLTPPNFFKYETPQSIILAPTGQPKSYNAFEDKTEDDTEHQDLAIGSQVRVTRGQYFGVISIIDSFPDTPQATTSGLVTPGAYVTIDRAKQYIPLANLVQVT